MEVALFKQANEKVGPKLSSVDVANAYRQHVKFANVTSEKFSDSWVDQALTVYNRALSDPTVYTTVQQLEDMDAHNSLF